MKHSLVFKFLVILLTASSLVAAFGGGVGIVAMENAGLYVNDLSELQGQAYASIAESIADSFATRYVVENLGNIPYVLQENLFMDPADRSDADHWSIQLHQGGQLLAEEGQKTVALDNRAFSKEYTIVPHYPIVSLYGPNDFPPVTTPEEPEGPTQPEPVRSVYEEVIVPDGYLYYETETVWESGRPVVYYLYYYEAPEYTVTVYLLEDVLENSSLHILTAIYPHRYSFIALLAAGLIIFAAGIVYLCWSAGRAKDGTIRPGGLNRIPLDLYAGVAATGIVLLLILFFELARWVENEGPHPGNLSLIGVNLLAMTLLGIAFMMAFCAQIKVRGGYWWHHSIIGWCCGKLARGIRFLWRGCANLVGLLPLIWQWLLTAALMALSVLILFALSWNGSEFFLLLLFLDIIFCIGIVIYGGYAFGTLIKGANKMSEGDLSYKIPAKYLIGSFKDFADRLNSLSETAMIAAENEMRSERMKSELITNVSHDIKTPLTSIINFVDLLKKPHSPEQSEEYLEVLSRQSERMKRLIEDLMDLSKANSGNMAVNIVRIDAAETVNQALGEFSDKLEAAQLVPVFRQPDQPVIMEADGRLVWRILSNLLGNAIKYAMPGTRLYIDLMRIEDQVLLSLKNISKEQLNIRADELMERFVRGDTSRNSEGSGLGLNIAKSLMEVQHGQLQLLLDGDLFKVTLIFPAV